MAKKHKHSNIHKHKKRSYGTILAVVFIVLVVLGLGYFVYDNVDSANSYKNFNGFLFEQSGEYWITGVELEGQPYTVPFYNHPLDLDDVYYDPEVSDYILDVPHTNFIIAVHPDAGSLPVLAGVNIARVTGRFYGVPTSSALYIPQDELSLYNETGLPVIDCSLATSDSPVLWMNIDESAAVVRFDENNPHCIIVGGSNGDEILASADMFVYRILGIIK